MILDKLAVMPPGGWLAWARDKPAASFQHDRYGAKDFMTVNHATIGLAYEGLMLSLEGKVLMEVYGRQFGFLSYTMSRAFQQFKLAGALRVYLTG